MAKISELLLQMKKYMDQFGDVQVVFKYPDNSIKDILSCGMSKAVNIKEEDISVCWLAGEFINQPVDTSEPKAEFTE